MSLGFELFSVIPPYAFISAHGKRRIKHSAALWNVCSVWKGITVLGKLHVNGNAGMKPQHFSGYGLCVSHLLKIIVRDGITTFINVTMNLFNLSQDLLNDIGMFGELKQSPAQSTRCCITSSDHKIHDNVPKSVVERD